MKIRDHILGISPFHTGQEMGNLRKRGLCHKICRTWSRTLDNAECFFLESWKLSCSTN